MTNVSRTEPTRRTLARHLVVTAVATPANLAAYLGLLSATAWSAVACNLVAAVALAAPTFVISRAWVWSVTGNVAAQAGAFWTTTVVNVLAASAWVWWAERAALSGRTLAVVPLVVYSALWLARFWVLDRLVFRRQPARGAAQLGT